MILPAGLDQFPVRRVIVPPYPGLFSALGLASADHVYSDSCGGYRLLTPEAAPSLNAIYSAMESRLLERVGVANFHERYARLNGSRFDRIPVEGAIYRVQVTLPSDKVEFRRAPPGSGAKARRTVALRYLYDTETPAAEFERDDLGASDRIQGPAIVRDEMSTTFVPAGRSLTVGERGELIIE